MYRWVPGNRTRARTEPAPSELLKATGMQPDTRRAEPPPPNLVLTKGVSKGCAHLKLATTFRKSLQNVHATRLFVVGNPLVDTRRAFSGPVRRGKFRQNLLPNASRTCIRRCGTGIAP